MKKYFFYATTVILSIFLVSNIQLFATGSVSVSASDEFSSSQNTDKYKMTPDCFFEGICESVDGQEAIDSAEIYNEKSADETTQDLEKDQGENDKVLGSTKEKADSKPALPSAQPANNFAPERSGYNLPYKPATGHYVSQAYNSNFSHYPDSFFAYSIDFIMPVGTELLAIKDGVVDRMTESYTQNCPSGGCLGNIITIKHGDDTTSLYYHLKPYSIPDNLYPGSFVRRGQKIGESGNTGWSTGPHLHFALQNYSSTSAWAQSKPIAFEECYMNTEPFKSEWKIGCIPEVGKKYTALFDSGEYSKKNLNSALEVFNDEMYQVHVGSNNRIYSRKSVDGYTWTNWITSDDPHEFTKHSLAMESYGGKIFQSHVGNNNRIYTRSSPDGVNWTGWITSEDPHEYTHHAVSFGTLDGLMFQSHIGHNNRIYTRYSSDAINWTGWITSTDPYEYTDAPISITSFKGRVYMNHLGGDKKVYVRSSADGKNWTHWRYFDPNESVRGTIPMAATNDRLYQSHAGYTARVYTRSSTNGNEWTGWADSANENMSVFGGMYMTSWNDRLYQTHIGLDKKIYIRRSVVLDGEHITWEDWQAIPGTISL